MTLFLYNDNIMWILVLLNLSLIVKFCFGDPFGFRFKECKAKNSNDYWIWKAMSNEFYDYKSSECKITYIKVHRNTFTITNSILSDNDIENRLTSVLPTVVNCSFKLDKEFNFLISYLSQDEIKLHKFTFNNDIIISSFSLIKRNDFMKSHNFRRFHSNFTCSIETKANVKRKLTILMIVSAFPQILEIKSVKRQVFRKTNSYSKTEYQCVTTGYPRVKSYWISELTKIKIYSSKFVHTFSSSNITNYKLTCIAENMLGTTSRTISIENVGVAITKFPDTSGIFAGGSKLICEAHGNPLPQVYWNVLQSPFNESRIHYVKSVILNIPSTLPAGIYLIECSARNSFENVSRRGWFNIVSIVYPHSNIIYLSDQPKCLVNDHLFGNHQIVWFANQSLAKSVEINGAQFSIRSNLLGGREIEIACLIINTKIKKYFRFYIFPHIDIKILPNFEDSLYGGEHIICNVKTPFLINLNFHCQPKLKAKGNRIVVPKDLANNVYQCLCEAEIGFMGVIKNFSVFREFNILQGCRHLPRNVNIYPEKYFLIKEKDFQCFHDGCEHLSQLMSVYLPGKKEPALLSDSPVVQQSLEQLEIGGLFYVECSVLNKMLNSAAKTVRPYYRVTFPRQAVVNATKTVSPGDTISCFYHSFPIPKVTWTCYGSLSGHSNDNFLTIPLDLKTDSYKCTCIASVNILNKTYWATSTFTFHVKETSELEYSFIYKCIALVVIVSSLFICLFTYVLLGSFVNN